MCIMDVVLRMDKGNLSPWRVLSTAVIAVNCVATTDRSNRRNSRNGRNGRTRSNEGTEWQLNIKQGSEKRICDIFYE